MSFRWTPPRFTNLEIHALIRDHLSGLTPEIHLPVVCPSPSCHVPGVLTLDDCRADRKQCAGCKGEWRLSSEYSSRSTIANLLHFLDRELKSRQRQAELAEKLRLEEELRRQAEEERRREVTRQKEDRRREEEEKLERHRQEHRRQMANEPLWRDRHKLQRCGGPGGHHLPWPVSGECPVCAGTEFEEVDSATGLSHAEFLSGRWGPEATPARDAARLAEDIAALGHEVDRRLLLDDYPGIANLILEVLLLPSQENAPRESGLLLSRRIHEIIGAKFGIHPEVTYHRPLRDEWLAPELRKTWTADTFYQLLIFAHVLEPTWKRLPEPYAKLRSFFAATARMQAEYIREVADRCREVPGSGKSTMLARLGGQIAEVEGELVRVAISGRPAGLIEEETARLKTVKTDLVSRIRTIQTP